MRNRPLSDLFVFTAIGVGCTCLAFVTLQSGRELVVRVGSAALRRELVRESDRLAERSMTDVLHGTGCRESGSGEPAHRSCVFLSAMDGTIRVALRVEPRNPLLLPDSAIFTLPSPAASVAEGTR
ncbi:MAG: hypothetical protein U0132_06050 [Gemmatimonadaceae bacterium]